ncbi:IclR family transcriptional regulator [Aeromicrobium phragmitis]|uniref:IclR family transcriptional regulator n=1 Tax=Aeromicrobium phragmitis TaxID=2478914 RepID=A0A3L8PK70_9ACTN|nr:IclR family transcriptional regulator [Aeromicrobium phragmitis]RLV55796.1 IclR family transcriptional regulator [Aeromicrobium phragmitis]
MAPDSAGTVGKALELLTCLGSFPHGASASQLAQRVDYPFSTVYRLLNTLVSTGYASFEPETKHYRLGLRVFQLSHQVANARGLNGLALPVLETLTAATGESSLLSVLDGERHLTVHKVDGPQFRITTDPGDHGPLHTTALGKTLVAFSAPAHREHLVTTLALPAQTPRSITDRATFVAEIERVRERGWATQDEENDVGMAALAVPVVAPGGRLLAALAVAAPVFRRSAQELEEFLPALRDAARQLALQLPPR